MPDSGESGLRELGRVRLTADFTRPNLVIILSRLIAYLPANEIPTMRRLPDLEANHRHPVTTPARNNWLDH